MDDKKPNTNKEEWSFELDKKHLVEAERKRSEKEFNELKKVRLQKKKKIELDATFSQDGSRGDLKAELEKEKLKNLKEKNIKREKVLSAPTTKRLMAFILDIILASLIFIIFLKTPVTNILCGQIKEYSGYDILAITQTFIDQYIVSEGKTSQPAGMKGQIQDSLKQLNFDLKPQKIYSTMLLIFSHFFLFIFSVMAWGKTPGKKIMGLQVVDENLQLLSWKRAFLRETFGKLLFGFGIVTIPFNKKKQSLYDFILKSRVIKYDDRLFNEEKVAKSA